MKQGDYVIYYSSKKWFDKKDNCQEFTAMGQVVGDAIYQVETSTNFHPYRLNVNFLETKEVSIFPLIDELEFITNKQKWGYPFRWGLLEINEHDFDLISRLLLNGQER